MLVFTKPNMLLASNLEISLLTTRSTSAEESGSLAHLENFTWALFGIMNTYHWSVLVSHVSACALQMSRQQGVMPEENLKIYSELQSVVSY